MIENIDTALICLQSRPHHLFVFLLFNSSLSAVECLYHPLERIMLIMPFKSQSIWVGGGGAVVKLSRNLPSRH
jgi:hypothetical protein